MSVSTRLFKTWALVTGLLLAWLVPAAPAWALTCSATVGNVAFGDVDVLGSTTYTTNTTATVTCSRSGLLDLGGPVAACLEVGAGSGGAAAGNNPRYLAGPSAATLNYNLYSGSGFTTVWNNQMYSFQVGSNGSGTSLVAIQGRLPTPQTSGRTGSYSSSFSGHARLIYFNLLGGLITLDVITNTIGLSGCNGLLGLGIPGVQTAQVNFTVTANVVKNCVAFAADDLDFGSVSALAGNRDAQTSMQVTCTRDAPWSIALDNGQNYSGSRRMRLGSGYVGYQLFRDAPRTQAWSSGAGNVASGTGTGASQSLPVYGRVPPQTPPGPGTYTDTVVATVTF